MYTEAEVQEYLEEIREQVCSHCVERPPGGPPCAPLGHKCGVEMHLTDYLQAIHEVESSRIEPYLDKMHRQVCSHCSLRGVDRCPCPLDHLLVLLVQAVETVDLRRRAGHTTAAASAKLMRPAIDAIDAELLKAII
jgi:hypothetical protein